MKKTILNPAISTKESEIIDKIRAQLNCCEFTVVIDDKRKKLPTSVYSCSITGYCNYRIFLDKTLSDEEKKRLPPLSEASEGVFFLGKVIHQIVQKLANFQGAESNVRYDYRDEFSIVGHVDGIIYDQSARQLIDNTVFLPQNGYRLIEIKSISPNGWKYVQERAQDHHVVQANLYARMMGIYNFSVLYVNKNDFDMIEHRYFTDEKLFVQTIQKLKEINDCVFKGKFTVQLQKEQWECNYCHFKRLFCQKYLEANENE